MKISRILTTSALVVGVAAPIVIVAPSVHGQSRGRALTVLEGRGGEIGVRIADTKTGGVEIEDVQPDSAASKAGLKAGDVILEFDGEHVRSSRQFARLVQETPPGRTVTATVSRDGQQQDVQITTAERPGSAMVIDGDFLRGRLSGLDRLSDLPFNFSLDHFDLPGFSGGGRLGVTVTELTTQLADHLGAKGGVLVTSVADGSPASRAGLRAGDVITSLNGADVGSRDDLGRALRQVEGEEVAIGIVRDKHAMSLSAKIEVLRRPMRGRPA
jgi:serine protease Do